MGTRLSMAGLTVAICVGATLRGQGGEVKVTVEQTPPAVQQTIRNELVGARLESIAKKLRNGETVYETDVIKDGYKWEVVVGGDGRILSRLREEKVGAEPAGKAESGHAPPAGWRQTFAPRKSDLAPTGRNPWLTMQPGRVLELRHGIDTLTLTVLNETRTVDGVEVGVLEERETKGGKLAEVSRNFFATSVATGDVYYFGEEVDNYKDSRIVDHQSAWLAGQKGARFGLMIPGRPQVGDRFYQEIAPRIAMDRVEILATDETIKTPAGTFEHCLHLKETTPLEADVSHKVYAPGVGLVKDDAFELTQKP